MACKEKRLCHQNGIEGHRSCGGLWKIISSIATTSASLAQKVCSMGRCSFPKYREKPGSDTPNNRGSTPFETERRWDKCACSHLLLQLGGHVRSRVLPPQAVDRGRRRTRLLDDHRSGSDTGPLRRSEFMRGCKDMTPYSQPTDWVFPSFRSKGRRPRTAKHVGRRSPSASSGGCRSVMQGRLASF